MDDDNRTLGEIFGAKTMKMKRLRNETRATMTEVKAALEDADFDIEEARELLRQRDQIEMPEKRRVQRVKMIEDLKKSKPEWRQACEKWCRKWVAELDERIAKLEEKHRRDV
jgi:DNA-binding transcriptional MerR regulator